MEQVYRALLPIIIINQVVLFYLSGRMDLWRHHSDILRMMRLNNITFYLVLLLYIFNFCGHCISCINPQLFN